MSDYQIFKLKHLTPVHIGTGRENYDSSASELQSDTLSSALASIRAQRSSADGLFEFLNSFSISSAFPFWNDWLFLPKPQGKLNLIEVKGKELYECRKRLKNVRYIELSLWQKIIAGQKVVVEESQISGLYLLPQAPSSSFTINKKQVNERVSVPRDSQQDAEPFYFEWNYYDRNAGVFCLVEANNEVIDEIESLFRDLGEEGIGTDRSVGGGRFEVERATIQLPQSVDADTTMLLSLFIPTESELSVIDLSKSRYNLLMRGGYISGSTNETIRHLRKRSIYMFDVGSCFSNVPRLVGKVVNLRPQWDSPDMHDIFRSGRAICVHIKHPSYE